MHRLRLPPNELSPGIWEYPRPDGSRSLVAKLASFPLRTAGEGVLRQLVGMRFDRIEVRLTFKDFLDQGVHTLIREYLVCRVSNPRTSKIKITVEDNVP